MEGDQRTCRPKIRDRGSPSRRETAYHVRFPGHCRTPYTPAEPTPATEKTRVDHANAIRAGDLLGNVFVLLLLREPASRATRRPARLSRHARGTRRHESHLDLLSSSASFDRSLPVDGPAATLTSYETLRAFVDFAETHPPAAYLLRIRRKPTHPSGMAICRRRIVRLPCHLSRRSSRALRKPPL